VTASDFRHWPIATEILVRWNVGDQAKSGLIVLNVSFVARDPKPTYSIVRDQRTAIVFCNLLAISSTPSR
jgi:hypothetical protein